MKKYLAFLLAVMLMMSLFAGCGGQAEEPVAEDPAPVEDATPEGAVVEENGAIVMAADEEQLAEKLTEDGTIVVGLYGYTMGNMRASQSRNYAVLGQCFDTLFTQDRSTSNWVMKNVLCENYEYTENEDGTWTVHLKIYEGAKFASGEEITAEDVLWSIQDIMSGSWGGKFTIVDFDNSYTEGNYDVYLLLTTYDPDFIECLATPNMGIENKSWAETASEEDWWDKADASGPFELVEMVNGSHALMKVRDDYWGWGITCEKPSYEYLKTVFYGEAATMVIDFENGDIDMACSLAPSDVKRITEDGGMEHATLALIPTGSMMSLIFNPNVEVLQDYNVRKAIALCVDVEAITEAVAGPLGEVATGFISPGPAGDFFIDFGVNEYDPAKAKTLLEEAGYKDGDINLKMVIKIAESDQNFAIILQAALAEIGINLSVEEYETSTAIQTFREGGTDLCFNLMSSGLHPSTVYTNRQSDTTLLSVEIIDDEVQQKLAIGNTTQDMDEAHEVYTFLQNYQYENCTEVPLYDNLGNFLYKDYVDASTVCLYQLSGICDMRNIDLVG